MSDACICTAEHRILNISVVILNILQYISFNGWDSPVGKATCYRLERSGDRILLFKTDSGTCG